MRPPNGSLQSSRRLVDRLSSCLLYVFPVVEPQVGENRRREHHRPCRAVNASVASIAMARGPCRGAAPSSCPPSCGERDPTEPSGDERGVARGLTPSQEHTLDSSIGILD